jgi:hypothetical protein
MKSDRFDNFNLGAIIVLTLIGLIATSGCASLGKEECLNADWRTIGYEDGTRGYPGSRIGTHRKACAKHGVTPNLDQYEEGRLMGLREYCTPRNGYRLGTNGKRVNGVCPPDLAPAFRQAMREGQRFYALKKEAQQQRRELQKAYEDLDALEIELKDKEAKLIKARVSPKRRKQLLDELRILEDEQEVLLAEIAEMERTLELMQVDLTRLREQSPYK